MWLWMAALAVGMDGRGGERGLASGIEHWMELVLGKIWRLPFMHLAIGE